jgi:PST family polysaccharide transporter
MGAAVNPQVGDGSLFARAGKALGWSFLSTAVSRFGTLAVGIALARILQPREFGVFAVALVALLAVLSCNELGVSLAIVRWPGDPREIAPTVATISLCTSCLLYLGCFIGAPAFAAAMGAPQAAGPVRLLTLCVVVSGVVAVPAALMQRHFRQDHKTIADQVTNWLGALVSIGCALAGLGAVSLAIGQLTGTVAGGVIFVVLSPEPLRFGFDRAKARALFRFGLPLAGSSILVFAIANVDRLIVGTVLNATALGFYVLAFNLSNWPVAMFSQPVRAVAPAAFSRLQGDPATMRSTFVSTAGLLAAVTLPVCVLLSAAAQPLIHFVYGSSWARAADALAWLGLLGALRILFELVYDYFVVLGSSRVVFAVQVLWLGALVPALIAGASLGGIAGAALAQFLVALIVVLPIYLYELRGAGITPGRLSRRLAVPLAFAAGVGVVAAVVHRLISLDLLALAIAGTVTAATMGLLVYRMRAVIDTLRTVEVSK